MDLLKSSFNCNYRIIQYFYNFVESCENIQCIQAFRIKYFFISFSDLLPLQEPAHDTGRARHDRRWLYSRHRRSLSNIRHPAYICLPLLALEAQVDEISEFRICSVAFKSQCRLDVHKLWQNTWELWRWYFYMK